MQKKTCFFNEVWYINGTFPNRWLWKLPNEVLGWRNWQTRTVEVRMEQSLGVQVPPRVPNFKIFCALDLTNRVTKSILYVVCTGNCAAMVDNRPT